MVNVNVLMERWLKGSKDSQALHSYLPFIQGFKTVLNTKAIDHENSVQTSMKIKNPFEVMNVFKADLLAWPNTTQLALLVTCQPPQNTDPRSNKSPFQARTYI